MRNDNSSSNESLTISKTGVLFVSGYATSLRIERRQLIVRTGSGRDIVEGAFSKVTKPRLRRIVIFGTAGHLSLPVLDWIRGVGATLVFIDRNGEVLASSIEGPKDARLLRAQALAPFNATGVMIAKLLITEKLQGQVRALRFLGGCDDAIEGIGREAQVVRDATSLQSIRAAEARAASLYWSSWTGIEIRFARRDLAALPPHWRTFDQRRSLLSGTARKASDPINSLVNYGGALAQIECEIACRRLALSPNLAIIHGDVVNRPGFALDLQEVVRPEYELALLQLLRSQTFSLRDFGEDREGRCIASRRMARYLAESIASWTTGLAPVAEEIAQLLADSSRLKLGSVPTRLTQNKRKIAKERPISPERTEHTVGLRPPKTCGLCGTTLNADRSFCDACLPARKNELVAEMLQKSNRIRTGRPRSMESKTKQSETMRRRNRELAEWERAHPEPADTNVFFEMILPGLQNVSVRTIARATGLSSRYASAIRRGQKIPHPRHFSALRSLAEELNEEA